MKPKEEPGDAPVGICARCGIEAEAILIDFGIGPYEFGSQIGTDEDWRYVSRCCEDEIVPCNEEYDE